MMVVAAGGWNFDVKEHQMKLCTACLTLTSKQMSLGFRGTNSKWDGPTCLASMMANDMVLDKSNMSSGTKVAAGVFGVRGSKACENSRGVECVHGVQVFMVDKVGKQTSSMCADGQEFGIDMSANFGMVAQQVVRAQLACNKCGGIGAPLRTQFRGSVPDEQWQYNFTAGACVLDVDMVGAEQIGTMGNHCSELAIWNRSYNMDFFAEACAAVMNVHFKVMVGLLYSMDKVYVKVNFNDIQFKMLVAAWMSFVMGVMRQLLELMTVRQSEHYGAVG